MIPLPTQSLVLEPLLQDVDIALAGPRSLVEIDVLIQKDLSPYPLPLPHPECRCSCPEPQSRGQS